MNDKKKTLKAGSFADYEWAIDKHIKPGLETVRLRDLERKHVRALLEGRTTLNGGKKKVLTVLRAALQDAIDEHDPPLLVNNPAARLFKKRSGAAVESSANDESWTPQEI